MGAETFVCSAFVRELYSTALAPREGFACAASFVGLPQPHAPHTEQALRSLPSPTPPTPPHLLNPIQPCSPLATYTRLRSARHLARMPRSFCAMLAFLRSTGVGRVGSGTPATSRRARRGAVRRSGPQATGGDRGCRVAGWQEHQAPLSRAPPAGRRACVWCV